MHRSASASPTPAVDYERHWPEETPLYGIVETYYPQFLTRLEADGGSLPGFVKQAFDDYLKCGRLEPGFLRVKCDACSHEHLVAFSCKRRELLRASCPAPYGPAYGCSKPLPAVLSARPVAPAG